VVPTGNNAKAVVPMVITFTVLLLVLTTKDMIPQASVGTGTVQLWVCSQEPDTAFNVTFGGQVITGGVISTTVTIALQVAELAGDASSVTVKAFVALSPPLTTVS